MKFDVEIKSALDRARVQSEPYPHFTLEGVLPEAMYAQMQKKFPSQEVFSNFGPVPANNEAIKVNAKQVIESPQLFPEWEDGFRYLTSKEHFLSMMRVYSDSLMEHYPHLASFYSARVGISGLDNEEECDFLLDCQFALNTPVKRQSAVRGPLLDNF